MWDRSTGDKDKLVNRTRRRDGEKVEGYLTEKRGKKWKRKRGVKESGLGRSREYKGLRRKLLSSNLPRQNRNKYFRVKPGMPICPLDAPFVALRLPGIQDFRALVPDQHKAPAAASPVPTGRGKGTHIPSKAGCPSPLLSQGLRRDKGDLERRYWQRELPDHSM